MAYYPTLEDMFHLSSRRIKPATTLPQEPADTTRPHHQCCALCSSGAFFYSYFVNITAFRHSKANTFS